MSRKHRRIVEPLERRLLMAVQTVTNNNDSGAGSLRAAVTAAAAGDFVDLRLLTGTIKLTGGEIAISKNLTVLGPGADVLTLDGNNASRVFNVGNASVTISNVTLADGKSSGYGGAIYSAGSLILDRVTVRNSQGTVFGGGIYETSGTLTLIDSTIASNTTIGNDSNANPTAGGGVYAAGTMLTVSGSTFNDNAALAGIDTYPDSGWAGIGGGIYIGTGAASFVNSTITGNTAIGDSSSVAAALSGYGGGIASDTSGAVSLINCTITDNVVSGGTGTTGYSPYSQGGGAYFVSTPTLYNNLIAGNVGADNTQLWLLTGAIGGGNLITSNGATAVNGLANGVNGNQLDVDLSALGTLSLANNGGQTMTIKPNASAVRDLGVLGTDVTIYDERGFPRVGSPDIGAYEFQDAPITGRGNALQLDGVDDTVSVPAIAAFKPLGDQSYSISAWINLDAGATGTNTIFQYGDPGQSAFVLVYDVASQQLLFRGGSASTTILASVPMSSIAARWANVVAAYTQHGGGTIATLYLDGVLLGQVSATGSTTFTPAAQGWIGSWGGTSGFFKGEIDEVKLSSAFLSDTQLAGPNLTKALAASIVGDWHMDESSGSIIYDASSTSSNGTLLGVNPAAARPASDVPMQIQTKEDTAVNAVLPAYTFGSGALHFEIVSQPAKGTISILNDAGGLISYTPTANANGSDSFTYRAYDSETQTWSAAATVSVQIAAVNDAPTFTSSPANLNGSSQVNVRAAQAWSYNITAADVDGDTLTITGSSLPSWLTLIDHGGGSATLSGTPSATGNYTVTLKVKDGVATTTQSFTIVVGAANQAPTFTSTPPTTATADSLFTYNIVASDSDGDTPAITSGTLPAWLTLTDHGDGTATLSGTPSNSTPGPYAIVLTVSDGESSATQNLNFSVTPINHLPTLSLSTNQATVTQWFDATVTFHDADGDAISIISGPNGSGNPWVGETTDANGNLHFIGQPNNSNAGDEVFTVRLSDGKDTVDRSFTIHVTPTYITPTFNSAAFTNATTGVYYNYSITTLNPDGDPVTITAAGIPTWLTFTDYHDGTASLTGKATSTDVGTSNIVLSVSDSRSHTDQSFTLTTKLPNHAPAFSSIATLTGVVGQSYVYHVTTSDADGDLRTITAVSKPSWLTLTDNHDGTATLSGTPTQTGSGAVVLRVSDGTTHTDQSWTINGCGAPQLPAAPVFDDSTAPPATAEAMENYSHTFSASETGGTPLAFTLSGPAWMSLVDHGDGTATVSGMPDITVMGDSESVTVNVSDGSTTVAKTFQIDVPAWRWRLDGDGTLAIVGSNDADNIMVTPIGSGTLRVNYNGTLKNFAAGSVTSIQVYGQDGDDVLTLSTLGISTYVLGGAGNDTLIGGDQIDNLVGGGGKDHIEGNAGDDRLSGLAGNDYIAGGGGQDRLYGGDGNDVLNGGTGADRFWGDAGSDVLLARDKYHDQLYPDASDVVGDSAQYDAIDSLNGVFTPYG